MSRELHALELRIAHLRTDKALASKNREAILEFVDECAAEGLGPARQRKYVFILRTIAVRFTTGGFLLKSATEEELKQLVAAINRSSYSEATKVDFKKAIKKYYKVQNGRRDPEKTRFIRTAMSKPTQVTRADIFTEDEIQRVIAQFRNLRDRAFFAVMHESAARPAELLGCSIGDAEFRDDGDFIALRGIKGTPDRRNQLVSSGLLLREWIKCHPAGGNPLRPRDPAAPLWTKMEQTSCKNCGVPAQQHKKRGCESYQPLEIEQAEYAGMRKAFRRACAQAEIQNRRDRMYSLRHSRITEVSQFMSNQQLCRFSGWRPSSGQFEVYVHLTDGDVNSAIRAHYDLGMTSGAENVVCSICGARNLATAGECRNCLRPLTLKSVAKLEKLSEAVRVVAELQEKGQLERMLRIFSLADGQRSVGCPVGGP